MKTSSIVPTLAWWTHVSKPLIKRKGKWGEARFLHAFYLDPFSKEPFETQTRGDSVGLAAALEEVWLMGPTLTDWGKYLGRQAWLHEKWTLPCPLIPSV